MLSRGRVDVVPRPGALRPDVAGDLHARRIVERPGAHGHHLGRLDALAVDRGTAIAAEVAIERAAAVGPGAVALRGAALELERRARYHGVDAAARAGDLLATPAVAGAQLGDGHADGVAYGAAQAAAGERNGHGCPPKGLIEPILVRNRSGPQTVCPLPAPPTARSSAAIHHPGRTPAPDGCFAVCR